MNIIKISMAVMMLACVTFAFTATDTKTATVSSAPDAPFKPVAVIELFTSQGCSSCPSADRLLTRTLAEAKKEGREVLALSFHVDYWNRLGWKDPFSDHKYSERQNDYANRFGLNSVYTPQAIVNGKEEMVGSDEQKLKAAINTSLAENTIAGFKTLEVKSQPDHSAKVNFTLEGNYTCCDINVALVSLNESTSVKRGENSGATLQSENVVRQFVSMPAKTSGEATLNADPSPTVNNRAVIVYIQRQSDGKIIGAAMGGNF